MTHAVRKDRPEPSMEALWRQFRGELERFAQRRVQDPDVVEDILQTAFLRAHLHLRSAEPPRHPRAWLYQVVRNLVHDLGRAEHGQRALTAALQVEPVPKGSATAADDETFALVARTLPIFLQGLPDRYRRALELTELQGWTQAEAAEMEGVSLSGMKSRVQRGRRMVYQAMHRCCRFEVDARGRVIGAEPRNPDGCIAACATHSSCSS